MNRGISSIFLLKALVTSFFKNVIARSDEGAVANHEARQSLKIKQNPKGLLRRPSGTPRNDVLDGLYRSSLLRIVALAAITLLGDGCSSPNEPSITPPQPSFTAASNPPNPVDSRIYGDAGPTDAIDIEWNPDTSGNTSGYMLYRSINDSTVGSDGLLKNRMTVAQLESSNQLIQPLPTTFKDATGIVAGATYWYQLQAYYRSPNNNLTYSLPTHVDLTTSFNYEQRDNPYGPTGTVALQGLPLKFVWNDPSGGGEIQIVVERMDNFSYPYSALYPEFEITSTEEYPTDSTATPLVAGIPYRWRVKKIPPHGGSSSEWTAFQVSP